MKMKKIKVLALALGFIISCTSFAGKKEDETEAKEKAQAQGTPTVSSVAAPAQSPTQVKKQIIIYTGEGAWDLSYKDLLLRTKAFLKKRNLRNYSLHTFSTFEEIIGVVTTSKNGILMIPGGGALHMGAYLSAAFQKKGIDQEEFSQIFKKNQWSYLGICAGSFLAFKKYTSITTNPTLGQFIPKKSLIDLPNHTLAFLDLPIQSLYPHILGYSKKPCLGAIALNCQTSGGSEGVALWLGGPDLSPINPLPGVSILLKEKRESKTLAVHLPFGKKGSMVLSSVHPELHRKSIEKLRAAGYKHSQFEQHLPSGEFDEFVVEKMLERIIKP